LTIYFSGQEILGVALLPLVFYHPFQLFVAGLLKGLPFVSRSASGSPPSGDAGRDSAVQRDPPPDEAAPGDAVTSNDGTAGDAP
jgi:hypothetical protein